MSIAKAEEPQMNVSVRGYDRDSRMGRGAAHVRRRGTVHLALMLLLWLPATWAGAEDSRCDAMADMVLWATTGCERAAAYLARCEQRGKHVKEAKLCLAFDDVKACSDLSKAVDFKRRFGSEHKFADEIDRCIARLETNERIDRLLHACRVHFEQGRITSGLVGNALDCFKSVLHADPTNLEAMAGVEKITAHLVKEANEALESSGVDKAEAAIKELERLSPRHRELKGLRDRLAALKKSLRERDEHRVALKALEEKVQTLMDQEQYREALAEVQKGRDDELTSKLLARLEKEANRALAARENRQAQEKALAEARALRGKGEYDGARAKLEESRKAGLPDKEYRRELRAIDEAEKEARAKEGLARKRETLLAECRAHLQAARLEEALACYRELLKLDPGHAEAGTQVLRLTMFVAWIAADGSGTVERYFAFEETYKKQITGFASADLRDEAKHLVQLAREKLHSLHDEYWQSVKAANTREAYSRYVEIFSEGPNADEARAWLRNAG